MFFTFQQNPISYVSKLAGQLCKWKNKFNWFNRKACCLLHLNFNLLRNKINWERSSASAIVTYQLHCLGYILSNRAPPSCPSSGINSCFLSKSQHLLCWWECYCGFIWSWYSLSIYPHPGHIPLAQQELHRFLNGKLVLYQIKLSSEKVCILTSWALIENFKHSCS